MSFSDINDFFLFMARSATLHNACAQVTPVNGFQGIDMTFFAFFFIPAGSVLQISKMQSMDMLSSCRPGITHH
jgi:hypothetical protein